MAKMGKISHRLYLNFQNKEALYEILINDFLTFEVLSDKFFIPEQESSIKFFRKVGQRTKHKKENPNFSSQSF